MSVGDNSIEPLIAEHRRDGSTVQEPHVSVADVDLAEALMNPEAVFGAPADVLTDERLTFELKVKVLCRWLYDATELSVAEEEGMGGGEPSRLDSVLAALHTLTGGVDVEHAAPTKHRGVCASG